MQLPTIVLDQVGDSWLAVTVGSSTCEDAQGEIWETFTVQPRPDGTLVGEATEQMEKGCANKRGVTFTRTGDVDVSTLADPNSLPPRVVSPAEALHGRYHQTNTQPNGYRTQSDWAVITSCLRTGDRCMSLFHTPPTHAWPLLFDGRTWTYASEFDSACSLGGTSHLKIVVPFPLPQPPQDPIALLTGHGHEDVTGSSPCKSTDVEMQFTRVGD